MGRFFSQISALTKRTPPLSEGARDRLASRRRVTIDEIDAELEKAGWRRFLGAG